MTDDARQELGHAVDRLVGRVQHWTPNRWTKPTSDGATTRADRIHMLAQCLADAAADAEGAPHRPVPRLDNDLALPDQLRALTADVLAAGDARPDALAALLAEVRDTTAALDG